MSYRKTYTGYVEYSGSVSYPASEKGGYVEYSGSEPVYVTIDVDTSDFDESVDKCNNAIGGLATAVVATEAAQIESKRKASSKIAASIVKGFFEYVSADLSQKMKELSSKCESLLVALIGHKDNCLAKSSQMQDDYHRISKRYSKIFEDLDRETISRIEMLDKPTLQFADTAQKVIDMNSNTELLGITAVSANENIQLETILSCSHVKQQANILLEKANNYLQGTYRLANSVRDMLSDSGDSENIFLPVMYTETINGDNNKGNHIYGTGNAYFPPANETDSQLLSKFMAKEIKWKNMDSGEYDKVISYLNANVQSEDFDKRTLKTMLELMNNQEIQTIKA